MTGLGGSISVVDLTQLDLRAVDDGAILRLRVRPGGRRDEVVGPHGGALKVSVTAPPERGKANQAVLRLLADRLGVAVGALEITAGSGSRDKTLKVTGLGPSEVVGRLAHRER
jgi:uncharacterized protein (TIGR00251 family)